VAAIQGAHPPATARRFLSPEEQTEPVDFSTANEPVNFSGSRLVALPPGYSYSRTSSPESTQQPYLDYRDNPAAVAAGKTTLKSFSTTVYSLFAGQNKIIYLKIIGNFYDLYFRNNKKCCFHYF